MSEVSMQGTLVEANAVRSRGSAPWFILRIQVKTPQKVAALILVETLERF